MLCWAEYLEAEADAEVERGRVEAMLDVGCLVLPRGGEEAYRPFAVAAAVVNVCMQDKWIYGRL
jgi:hypothetical protein